MTMLTRRAFLGALGATIPAQAAPATIPFWDWQSLDGEDEKIIDEVDVLLASKRPSPRPVRGAAPVYSDTPGYLKDAGDFTRLRMINHRTGEHLNTLYRIEGEIIAEAQLEIDRFMRDWRTDETIRIRPETIDVITRIHETLEVNEAITLTSGYRSPKTNAMLRSKSKGVARNSLHMKGWANDIIVPHRTVHQVAQAARTCGAGGVGMYSKSGFVHIDCGPIRTWGR